MNLRFSLTIAFLSIGLSGCVAAAVNTSTLAVKSAPRKELLPKAEAGDPIAQYELGKSYCCMGPGFDTQTATEWYCRSARQGNSDAMYELGRVYLGEISRTPAPGQKLRSLSAPKSRSHAHLWLSKAAEMGHAEAEKLLADLSSAIDEEELRQSRRLATVWRNAPCEYDDVFDN